MPSDADAWNTDQIKAIARAMGWKEESPAENQDELEKIRGRVDLLTTLRDAMEEKPGDEDAITEDEMLKWAEAAERDRVETLRRVVGPDEEAEDEIFRLSRKIQAAADEWYQLVGEGHHKDRDCHWVIEKRWSYGDSPVWFIEHNGYVHDDFRIECENEAQAHRRLLSAIVRAIAKECEFRARMVEQEPDWVP